MNVCTRPARHPGIRRRWLFRLQHQARRSDATPLTSARSKPHITTIAVHPDHRRCGIGTHLMLQLALDACARGATALTLEVRASNASAQGLYQRFGLAPVGVRKNYYEDLQEDAIIMWAHDIDTEEYAERLRRIEQQLFTGRPHGQADR